MSSYLPPSPNPIFNSKSFNTNDILININGLTTSARAYIDEKIEDISGDIADLSGNIITIIEDIESNTAQIQTNVSAISIIGGEIDTLETNVVDLSSQVLDLSTNTAKLNVANTFTENNTFSGDKQFIVNITGSATSSITFAGREVNIQSELLCGAGPTEHIDAKISGVLSVNQSTQGGTDDRAENYITTPKVEITTEPVDLSDATTKNYVDTAIAGVVIDDTSFARLDISNTFAEIQTFIKDIKAEEIDATKYKINDGTNEYVYGEYSNTYYVNDNEGGISGSINNVLALLTQGQLLKVSAGSYGDEDVLVEKTNIGISAPISGGKTITEIGTSGLSRTLTIDNSERVRMSGFQINGMTTINGTLHKHYFTNMSFNGGLTIDGGIGDFMIFKDCDINVGLTINATFGGVIYFYRIDFQNQPLTCNQPSPLQVIMIDCAGIPDDASLFAGNYFATGVTSFYKSGSLTIADLNPAYYVRDTSPSQDNELASKFYVDLEVATNKSLIDTNTLNISANTSNISTLQDLVNTNTNNIFNNTLAITTNTNNISTNTFDITTKQDTLIAGTGIEIVGATISATGGSSFVGFKAVVNPGLGLVTVGGGTISTYFNDTATLPYSYDTNGLFDTSTGIFTANTSGYWQISFKFYIFDGESTQAQTNQLKLIRSGVESALFITGFYNGQNDEVNTCCPLLAGDQIFIYHFTGTTRYVLDTATAFFEARFIGS